MRSKQIQVREPNAVPADNAGAPRHPAPSPRVQPLRRAPGQRFERPRVYFRFTPAEFVLSVAGSDESYRTTPHVAYDRRTSLVKEIGPEARAWAGPDIVVENGFQADGLVIGNVDLAEISFRYALEVFMQRVRKGQLPFLRWMKPDLLIHPTHLGYGQITPLEMQCLVDIAYRARVHSAAVYLGPTLDDLLLRTGHYVTARP